LDIDYDEITGSLTVDGTTLSFFGATKYVTPSSDVTLCFKCTPGSIPGVYFEYQRVVATGSQVVDGCDGCFVRLGISLNVMDGCYSAPVKLGKSFTYRYVDCSDEGGSTFIESQWEVDESQGFSEECMSLLIDFAETFAITGSVFFLPCYAAP
jgi:hypothetical protein